MERRPALRWICRALLALTLVGIMLVNQSPLFVIAALFVLVVPFEKLFPRHRQRLRRPGLGTDLAYAVAQPGLAIAGTVVGIAVAILSLAWVPGLLLRPFVAMLPQRANAIAAFLLFDLLTYWGHRWSHEVPFLWRFHSIHHSSQRMDWISGLRVHPLDGALLAPAFVFLVAAGFSPELGAALAAIQLVTGIFLHANVRWSWRPLHRLLITPEFHHWHHANEADAHNTNYAVFLPFWDILFRTYFMPRDRRPMVYGVDEPIPPTILGQIWHPLRGVRSPRSVIHHPIMTVRDVRRSVHRGIGQIASSTFRPRVSG